jgi:hypothetical protein
MIALKVHGPSYIILILIAAMTLAIVTTILNRAAGFVAWLDFHLQQCALIILHLDDSSKRALFEELCSGRSGIMFDGATDEPSMSRPNRVLLRQSSNLKHAISHIYDNRPYLGVEWRLHID